MYIAVELARAWARESERGGEKNKVRRFESGGVRMVLVSGL